GGISCDIPDDPLTEVFARDDLHAQGCCLRREDTPPSTVDPNRAKALVWLQPQSRDGPRGCCELAVGAPELYDLGAVMLNRVVIQLAKRRHGVAGDQPSRVTGSQRTHLPVPGGADVGFVLAIVEKDGDGGGRCVERDQPHQQLHSEGSQEPFFATFQPSPRTLRMTSAPKRRRNPWMMTSTALLETASSQP